MNGYILNLPKAKIARLAKLLEIMYKKLPEIMLKLQWLRNYLKWMQDGIAGNYEKWEKFTIKQTWRYKVF